MHTCQSKLVVSLLLLKDIGGNTLLAKLTMQEARLSSFHAYTIVAENPLASRRATIVLKQSKFYDRRNLDTSCAQQLHFLCGIFLQVALTKHQSFLAIKTMSRQQNRRVDFP